MLRNGFFLLASCESQPRVSSTRLLLPFIRHYDPIARLPLTERQQRLYPQVEQGISDEGYPILKVKPTGRNIFEPRKPRQRRSRAKFIFQSESTMDVNQDWPSIWPTAKTFAPSAVPLPLRQSFEDKIDRVPRGKHVNTELLKIANFLHLTPGAVKRHCTALKSFCTKWPENLETDEQVRAHFPVTLVTRDYCHSSPDIRDHRARIVELKINVNDLKLNQRDRVKLEELAMHRYDKATETLTITTDSCPMKIQNQDYAEYLLSAVYFESQEHQPWEKERWDEEAFKNIDLDEYRKGVEQKLGFNK